MLSAIITLTWEVGGLALITFYIGDLCWFALFMPFSREKHQIIIYHQKFLIVTLKHILITFFVYIHLFYRRIVYIKDEIPSSLLYNIILVLSLHVSTFHLVKWTYYKVMLVHSVVMKYKNNKIILPYHSLNSFKVT